MSSKCRPLLGVPPFIRIYHFILYMTSQVTEMEVYPMHFLCFQHRSLLFYSFLSPLTINLQRGSEAVSWNLNFRFYSKCNDFWRSWWRQCVADSSVFVWRHARRVQGDRQAGLWRAASSGSLPGSARQSLSLRPFRRSDGSQCLNALISNQSL